MLQLCFLLCAFAINTGTQISNVDVAARKVKVQIRWTLQSIQLFGSFVMRHCIGLKLAKFQAVSEPEISWLLLSVDDEWRHGGYHYRQCQRAWHHGGGCRCCRLQVAEMSGTFTSFIRALFIGGDILNIYRITLTTNSRLLYSIQW